MSLLKIKNLRVVYKLSDKRVTAVDDLNLEVEGAEFLAIVGESGCGKSTLALSIIGLLPRPPAEIVGGSIMYKGKDIVALNNNEMRQYRGTEIAMIFQEPFTSLNPVHRVGEQIAEAVSIRKDREIQGKNRYVIRNKPKLLQRRDRVHTPKLLHFNRLLLPQIKDEVIKVLKLVRIADPQQIMKQFPFELSIGMCQRIMISMALSQCPKLLIADEPTSALDVTTQAQVLKLIKELVVDLDTSVILITHNLAIASQIADRVIVMYAGRIVEDADVYSFFSEPLHPYTKGLLSCIPRGSKDDAKLSAIPGSVPDLTTEQKGCLYRLRCPFAKNVCMFMQPTLAEVKPTHKVACNIYAK